MFFWDPAWSQPQLVGALSGHNPELLVVTSTSCWCLEMAWVSPWVLHGYGLDTAFLAAPSGGPNVLLACILVIMKLFGVICSRFEEYDFYKEF